MCTCTHMPTCTHVHTCTHTRMQVGIHAGKDQEEREYAIRMFKEQKKDVLIGTDVASKGLDFPDVQVW